MKHLLLSLLLSLLIPLSTWARDPKAKSATRVAPDAVNGNISFADARVKTLCVANWDTNGDGELSMNEAAAVSNLGSVFTGNASITSFDELQYFTGLSSIASRAFRGCTSLTSVVIPESVIRLETDAFYECLSLTSITIPSNVSYIGEYVFSKCSGLNYIVVDDGNTTYNDGNGCNCIINKNTKTLVAGCKYSVIPSGVEVIQNGAFEKNFGLTSVTIPSSVKTIGSYVFKDCYNLESVNILSPSITFGLETFLNCSSLTSVSFHMDTPPAYTTDCFSGISSSCTLTVPSGTSSSYISAGWTSSIFKGGLEEMVRNISFMDSKVKALCVANWDTNGDGELSYQEAAAVSSLGTVFKGNTTISFFNELQYFTGLTSIADDAFRDCSNLSAVQIPSTVYSIGSYAFYSCSNLTSIYIPESVESIGGYAFYGCSMLQSITMPDKIISYLGEVAFDLINHIAIVHISNLETWLKTDFKNGNNPLRSGGRLYLNGQEIKNLVIPDNIRTLNYGAFEGCASLETVTLNNYITTIPNAAFANCHSLRTIYMPPSLKNIEVNAFIGCRNVSFVIPEKVSYIGPSGLRCGHVQNNNIIVKAVNPPSISSDTFLNQKGFIFVPSNSVASYKSASYWSQLSNQIMPLEMEKLILSENAEIGQWSNTSADAFQYNTWSYENDASGMRTPFVEVWRGTGNNLNNTTISHQTLTGLEPGSYIVQIQARAFNEGNTSVYPSGITFYANNATVKLADVGTKTIFNNESTEIYSLLSLTASVTDDGKLDIGFRIANATCDWVSFKNLLVIKSDDIQQNIDFADANVKALCVANWDTNGDGELSMNEAAAVTDLGDVFKEYRTITSFDELQYFTGLTSIGDDAFSRCFGLTSITIPSSVTSIGNNAFSNRSGLTSITIPSSVTSIGDGAFFYCTGLTSITIPSSVTSIGGSAFSSCSGLTSISVDSSNQYYNDGNGRNCIIETSTNALIAGCKNTVIPSNVTSIGGSAFSGCTGLTAITIPSSVTSIGNYAFSGCSGLTSITIPSSVTSIGYGAFSSCRGLTSIIIPSSVASIGDYAFHYCTGLTSITSNIKSPFKYGRGTFNQIPSSCVLYVPAGTRDAYIAKGWTEEVFKGGVIEMPENIDFADANVKALCVANWDTNGDGELSMSEAAAVTDLGRVFNENITITSFDELQYFTGVTSIGEIAFHDCDSLTSISIPESVVSIGKQAFWGCIGLSSITIPDGVISIGDLAFAYCDVLTSITIPSSVTSIGTGAFVGCPCLTSISVDSLNQYYNDGNGSNCIIETSTNILVRGCKNTVIPSSVTSIGIAAFDRCHDLTSITIPSSVTSIGYSAFYDCTGLTSITIPSSVASIEDRVFADCTGLTSISVDSSNQYFNDGNGSKCIIETSTNALIAGCKNTVIPSNVTSIGDGAFYGCSGLTSITIPSRVTSIGNYAFDSCSSLTSITSYIKEPFELDNDTFVDISSSCVLYVPAGTRDAYIAAGWTEDVFKGGVIEMPDPSVNEDTDISGMANVIYAENISVRKGDSTTLEIKMNNELIPTGCTFSITLPEGLSLLTDADGDVVCSTTDRSRKMSVIQAQGSSGIYNFALTPSTENATISGTSGTIMTLKLRADENMETGDYKVSMKKNSVSYKSGGMTADEQLSDIIRTVTVEDYLMGDVNSDGHVSLADAVMILYHYFGVSQTGFKEKAADVTGDGNISLADAIEVLYKYFGMDVNWVKERPSQMIDPD